ncbi:MAG: gliding motility protein GldB [Prevotella sp.]|nr:gliding motility protein GldB [Prevotella sp.]
MNYKTYLLIVLTLTVCGCHWRPWQSRAENSEPYMTVQRFDRIESLYLTTGDFSALQHLNLSFPMQTRTLIEDMLKIGQVDEQDINATFLKFFQDTTLQALIADAEQQYAQMDDIDHDLSIAFKRLQQWFPNMQVPLIYAQIGALDQSIVVANGTVGVSLEKYLGTDCPIYKQFGYTTGQLETMQRRYIVPDVLSFYLLNLYPLADFREASQQQRDIHIGKIQWIVNRALPHPVFSSPFIDRIDNYMRHYRHTTMTELLTKVNIE